MGFYHVNITLEDTISEDELMEEVNKLNNDDRSMVFWYSYRFRSNIDAERILRNISVSKDADVFRFEYWKHACEEG